MTTWLKVGGATLGTRTVAYNSATERRGLATSVTDSGFGVITGTYNADGDLETRPSPTAWSSPTPPTPSATGSTIR